MFKKRQRRRSQSEQLPKNKWENEVIKTDVVLKNILKSKSEVKQESETESDVGSDIEVIGSEAIGSEAIDSEAIDRETFDFVVSK